MRRRFLDSGENLRRKRRGNLTGGEPIPDLFPFIARRAALQAASGFPVAGPAQAFADPFVRVDPVFANAGLYGIVVSDGVGNLPVPEPEALLLAIVGLASVGGRPVRLAFRVTRPT